MQAVSDAPREALPPTGDRDRDDLSAWQRGRFGPVSLRLVATEHAEFRFPAQYLYGE
jgi:hypothetical protein